MFALDMFVFCNDVEHTFTFTGHNMPHVRKGQRPVILELLLSDTFHCKSFMIDEFGLSDKSPVAICGAILSHCPHHTTP